MHRELLNDSEYAQWSNLTLSVRGERVHSFRAIVEVRCPELLMVVQVIKKKKEKKNGHVGPPPALLPPVFLVHFSPF